ncbi:MAG TPA: formate dehydrogenase accessory protein FdhE [Thermoanaerobaculia bacterium]|nr:formate dehydrogenase accessory protein FdhE [Thermoanaerobaculia bacterium]
MHATLDPAVAFEKRAARATTLLASAPLVAEPLAFAAGLFRLQGRLAAAVLARHEDVPFTGTNADFPRLLDLLAPLLTYASEKGPPELAEAAAARHADADETALARLAVYWSGEREAKEDYLSRASLRPWAEVLASQGVTLERPRHPGHCPACGNGAVVGVRREMPEATAAARFLACALCGTEWPFPRIRCAACQEEDPAKLPSFQTEAHPAVRIEACETCRRYVKSLDLTLDARPLPEVDDLVSLAMDLWAIEEGWTRLEPGWAGI